MMSSRRASNHRSRRDAAPGSRLAIPTARRSRSSVDRATSPPTRTTATRTTRAIGRGCRCRLVRSCRKSSTSSMPRAAGAPASPRVRRRKSRRARLPLRRVHRDRSCPTTVERILRGLGAASFASPPLAPAAPPLFAPFVAPRIASTSSAFFSRLTALRPSAPAIACNCSRSFPSSAPRSNVSLLIAFSSGGAVNAGPPNPQFRSGCQRERAGDGSSPAGTTPLSDSGPRPTQQTLRKPAAGSSVGSGRARLGTAGDELALRDRF